MPMLLTDPRKCRRDLKMLEEQAYCDYQAEYEDQRIFLKSIEHLGEKERLAKQLHSHSLVDAARTRWIESCVKLSKCCEPS